MDKRRKIMPTPLNVTGTVLLLDLNMYITIYLSVCLSRYLSIYLSKVKLPLCLTN
jgi:hypothetical protein